MTAEMARRIGYEFLLNQTIEGKAFSETYTEVGLAFSLDDVEFVREEDGEVRIGFWRGNSNLYWPVPLQEWERWARTMRPNVGNEGRSPQG